MDRRAPDDMSDWHWDGPYSTAVRRHDKDYKLRFNWIFDELLTREAFHEKFDQTLEMRKNRNLISTGKLKLLASRDVAYICCR